MLSSDLFGVLEILLPFGHRPLFRVGLPLSSSEGGPSLRHVVRILDIL